METKEENRSPVISLFSMDFRYLQSLCRELWVEPCRKERKLHKEEIRKLKQSELMVKELWGFF